LISVFDDPKVQNTLTSSKKDASIKYNPDKDYNSVYSADLKRILETVK